MVRRGLISGYIKVPEFTKRGKQHLHILFRGHYIPQELLSLWWNQIHKSSIVWIEYVRLHGGNKAIAGYMAKYMSKDMAGRYSWSWGWVWRGFCRDWHDLKHYCYHIYGTQSQVALHHALRTWRFWLHGLYSVDREAMKNGLTPSLVFKINKETHHDSTNRPGTLSLQFN
jgi:hypothetical protein